MRPSQTAFTSLDTFMAAHSPRRFCEARQKYILSKYLIKIRIHLCPVTVKWHKNADMEM